MPLKINTLKLDSRAVAAPMAGFTDRAWRIIARKMGAGLVFSEMVSVEGLLREGAGTLKYIENDERARPFGIQLFGAEPESFVKALDVIARSPSTHGVYPERSRGIRSGQAPRRSNPDDTLDCFSLDFARDRNDSAPNFDLIDINMGCPVKKVVSRGSGAALMKEPIKAGAIIRAVRKNYTGALTVKIRAGWDVSSVNALEMAKIAESEGVDAVIVHPRTKCQQFKGFADWSLIRQVNEALSIPVIGNGDVTSKESYDKMIAETGCDFVMIGREAIKNPWIFRIVNGGNPPNTEEIFTLIRDHLELLRTLEDQCYGLVAIRKFIAKYLKGMSGCRHVFENMYAAKTFEEIESILGAFEKTLLRQG